MAVISYEVDNSTTTGQRTFSENDRRRIAVEYTKYVLRMNSTYSRGHPALCNHVYVLVVVIFVQELPPTAALPVEAILMRDLHYPCNIAASGIMSRHRRQLHL